MGGVVPTFNAPRRIRRVGDEQIGLKIEPLLLKGGASCKCTIALANRTRVVQHLLREIEGIHRAFYRFTDPNGEDCDPVQLNPSPLVYSEVRFQVEIALP